MPFIDHTGNDGSNLCCQERGDGISYLVELLGTVTLEEVVVWEGLQPCSLSDCQAAALHWIVMDEVVTILGDVTGDGS